jgi:transcriptional regulator with XRE-family HTH domain
MNEFAKFLEKKMTERNITARELSSDLNVAQSYIYNWLKSQRLPSTKKEKNHLDMISKVLHLSLIELQELRESYALSKEGNLESEKKNIISNILKMPMPVSNYSLNCNKLMDCTYKIIEKRDFIEFLEIVLCNDKILNNGDNVYISCQEVFDIRYFNVFFEAVKKLLNKGVNIIHILTLEDNLNTIRIFEKLIPLNLVKAKGTYTTRYLTKYESESLTEMIYTKNHAAIFLNKGIIVHTDKNIKELMKLEFESYINNTLNFVQSIDEITFTKKIKNMLSTRGNVYSTLGCRHYDLLLTVFTENSTKLNKIFFENEILDVLTEKLIKIPEGIESLEDFKYLLYEYSDVLVINEEYYSNENPVYSIVKKDELILIFYINDEKIILNTSERIITGSFENFYKRIIYKYSGEIG